MTVWWLDQSAYTLPKWCGRSLLHTHVARSCSGPLLPGVAVLQHLPSVVALLQAGERGREKMMEGASGDGCDVFSPPLSCLFFGSLQLTKQLLRLSLLILELIL